MKKMIFLLVILFIAAGANAQLANTKWGFTLKMNDNDVASLCAFSKDTLTVTAEGDGSLIEKMVFTDKDGVLTIKKVEGQSECNDEAGSYKYEIKDNTLTLTLVTDGCSGRGEILDKAKWVKK